ncbi:hypothetical protein AGMMS49992_20250 [Clostridia bacterium]|nr:hypothetical protein AGMMS49992_20250 [Clostridia bacterium]
MAKEKQPDNRKRIKPTIVRLPLVQKRSRQEWESDDNPMILRGLAMQCMSYPDLAEVIGISRTQLFRWRRQSQIIRDAVEIGRNEADAIIISATFDSAMKGDPTAREQWWKYRTSRVPAVYEEEKELQVTANGTITAPASMSLLEAMMIAYKDEISALQTRGEVYTDEDASS